VRAHLEGIDGQLDVHVALDLAAAHGIGEFLGRLGDDREAIVVEPVDQRPDRGIFLILDQRGVVVGAQQVGLGLELGEQAPIVDVDADCLAGRVEIGAIDEKDDLSRGDRWPWLLSWPGRPASQAARHNCSKTYKHCPRRTPKSVALLSSDYALNPVNCKRIISGCVGSRLRYAYARCWAVCRNCRVMTVTMLW
jgi:hypothetical protein